MWQIGRENARFFSPQHVRELISNVPKNPPHTLTQPSFRTQIMYALGQLGFKTLFFVVAKIERKEFGLLPNLENKEGVLC